MPTGPQQKMSINSKKIRGPIMDPQHQTTKQTDRKLSSTKTNSSSGHGEYILNAPYEDLTNTMYAQMLKQSLEISDLSLLGHATQEECDDYLEHVGKPYHRFEFDKYAKVPHLPEGYSPSNNHAIGKCFTYAIASQWLLYFYSLDRNGDSVNACIVDLLDIIREFMPNKCLLKGIEEMIFIPIEGTVHDVLNANAVILHLLVYNAMIAIIHSWYHPSFMSHIPEDYRDKEICDFRSSISIPHDQNMNVTSDSGISAIDNIARCHVLKLFGVETMYCLQFAGTVNRRNQKGQITSENMKRESNSMYQIELFTLPGRKYAGFIMNIPREQLLFQFPTEMHIHSFDTTHYDTLIAHRGGIPSVPCSSKERGEKLPNQVPYPGIKVIMKASDIPMHFTL